jgi:hypothetical protein
MLSPSRFPGNGWNIRIYAGLSIGIKRAVRRKPLYSGCTGLEYTLCIIKCRYFFNIKFVSKIVIKRIKEALKNLARQQIANAISRNGGTINIDGDERHLTITGPGRDMRRTRYAFLILGREEPLTQLVA